MTLYQIGYSSQNILRVEDILPRLERVRQNGNARWQASCPVAHHEDRNPSFSLTEGDGGKALGYCHGGCDQRDVFNAMLELAGHTSGYTEYHAQTDLEADRQSNGAESLRLRLRYEAARCMWNEATDDLAPVRTYFASRGLAFDCNTASVRFNPLQVHELLRRQYPAMIAAIVDPMSDLFRGVHQTFLRPDFQGKASIEKNEQKLCKGFMKGNVIKLHECTGDTLIIGEGIENALSAARLFQRPAWSAINAGNMHNIRFVPDHIKLVIIAADNGEAGIRGVDALADNLTRTGVTCLIITPPEPFGDWNDYIVDALEQGDVA